MFEGVDLKCAVVNQNPHTKGTTPMRTISFGRWIANAAAGLTGPHGAVTRAGPADRLQPPERLRPYPEGRSGRRGRTRRRTDAGGTDPGERSPPPGKHPTVGVAVPDHRVSSAQATEVHRHGDGHGVEPQSNPRLAGDSPGCTGMHPVARRFIAGSKPPEKPRARFSSDWITPAERWCWWAVSMRSSSTADRSWWGSNPRAWCGFWGKRPAITKVRPGLRNCSPGPRWAM